MYRKRLFTGLGDVVRQGVFGEKTLFRLIVACIEIVSLYVVILQGILQHDRMHLDSEFVLPLSYVIDTNRKCTTNRGRFAVTYVIIVSRCTHAILIVFNRKISCVVHNYCILQSIIQTMRHEKFLFAFARHLGASFKDTTMCNAGVSVTLIIMHVT